MAWRNCNASLTLVSAINARWPNRDKASDGTIGDAAHASRTSDHNPWVKVDGVGVVRASDIDKDGIDANWLAEELRKLGAAGDPRLAGGGYVIWNRRITSPDFSRWNPYNGPNPHTKHVHVSFSTNRAGFDSNAGWAFLGGPAPAPGAPAPAPGGIKWGQRVSAPLGSRTIGLGSIGSDVAFVQRWHGIKDDGEFGYGTEGKVKETQRSNGLAVDGVVGPRTWAVMGIGKAAPAPAPAPARPAAPQRLNWPFPANHYVGDRRGPAASRGGANPGVERDFVRNVQQWFIYKGVVPGVPAHTWATSRWADGLFDAPASTNAAIEWHRRFYPGQPRPAEIWRDDYDRLARP